MPSDPTPFNSIGQIIEGGGLKGVSIGLSHGWSEQRATEYVQRNWPGASQAHADEIIRQARQTSDAGRNLTASISNALARSARQELSDEQYESMFGEEIRLGVTRAPGGQFARLPTYNADLDIDISDIPIIPEIMGDTPGGNRIELSMDISRPDGSGTFRIDTFLVGDETIADLLDEIPNWMSHWAIDSPDSFKEAVFDGPYNLQMEVLYAARKY